MSVVQKGQIQQCSSSCSMPLDESSTIFKTSFAIDKVKARVIFDHAQRTSFYYQQSSKSQFKPCPAKAFRTWARLLVPNRANTNLYIKCENGDSRPTLKTRHESSLMLRRLTWNGTQQEYRGRFCSRMRFRDHDLWPLTHVTSGIWQKWRGKRSIKDVAGQWGYEKTEL